MSLYHLVVKTKTPVFAGQSLARNKRITLSSLSDQRKWDKSGAVDGNYDRDAFGCKCCAGTGKGIDPWVEIDLGEVNSFSRIVIYGRMDFDSPVSKCVNFCLCVSDRIGSLILV